MGVAKSRGAEVDSGRARRGKGRGRRDDRVKGAAMDRRAGIALARTMLGECV
mgnify:CR=1 FL=1